MTHKPGRDSPPGRPKGQTMTKDREAVERDLTGEPLFFRCGHERTPENSAPKGKRKSGLVAVRCRHCKRERDKRAIKSADARKRAIERARERRRQAGARRRVDLDTALRELAASSDEIIRLRSIIAAWNTRTPPAASEDVVEAIIAALRQKRSTDPKNSETDFGNGWNYALEDAEEIVRRIAAMEKGPPAPHSHRSPPGA